MSKACLASFQPTAQNPLQSSLQQVPEEVQRDTQASEPLPSPWNPSQAFQQRSTATRSFLADEVHQSEKTSILWSGQLDRQYSETHSGSPRHVFAQELKLNFGREDSTAGQVTRRGDQRHCIRREICRPANHLNRPQAAPRADLPLA